MIYYSIPYSTDKNLGGCYNRFMEVLPNDEDFACFVDGDTIFTTPFYGKTIEEATRNYPDVGCFTCYTNRVYCSRQIAPGVDTNSNDINYHRNFGKKMETVYGASCIDITATDKQDYISGVLILIQKKLWKKVGKFAENGMLGIDNDIHKKIANSNEKLYLMRGIYLYHWYRWPNVLNISHLL